MCRHLLRDIQMEDGKVTRFVETREKSVLEECIKAKLQLVVNHFGIHLRTSKVAKRRIDYSAPQDTRGGHWGRAVPSICQCGEDPE